MEIKLDNIGKRFRYEWIFKELSFTFKHGNKYAILGHNGAGKSTLLQILSGHLSPSSGKIQFLESDQAYSLDQLYKHISYTGPYVELIEEFTLLEILQFHQKFKPFLQGLASQDIIQLLGLEKAKNKEIRFFSSGMKQRLKLVLGICTNVSLVLLDEPTTNLDKQGIEWYRKLINDFAKDRLIIIASNVEHDYDFCQEQLEISKYK